MDEGKKICSSSAELWVSLDPATTISKGDFIVRPITINAKDGLQTYWEENGIPAETSFIVNLMEEPEKMWEIIPAETSFKILSMDENKSICSSSAEHWEEAKQISSSSAEHWKKYDEYSSDSQESTTRGPANSELKKYDEKTKESYPQESTSRGPARSKLCANDRINLMMAQAIVQKLIESKGVNARNELESVAKILKRVISGSVSKEVEGNTNKKRSTKRKKQRVPK